MNRIGLVDMCRILQLPKIHDVRGNLSFIESSNHIPFKIKRAYWIYEVPGGEIRGGHAYKELHEFIVAMSGSFDVVVDDGIEKKTFTLNRSFFGLYVPNMLWRDLENFSTNAVALFVASKPYSEEDYIRDYHEYKQLNSE